MIYRDETRILRCNDALERYKSTIKSYKDSIKQSLGNINAYVANDDYSRAIRNLITQFETQFSSLEGKFKTVIDNVAESSTKHKLSFEQFTSNIWEILNQMKSLTLIASAQPSFESKVGNGQYTYSSVEEATSGLDAAFREKNDQARYGTDASSANSFSSKNEPTPGTKSYRRVEESVAGANAKYNDNINQARYGSNLGANSFNNIQRDAIKETDSFNNIQRDAIKETDGVTR